MLSYQHVFHAGNHADVLKHVVLVQTLLYTCRKETPFFYIDTHAGAGVYSLEGAAARKKAESDNGIGKIGLEKTVPGPIESYLQEVRRINPDGKLRFYPGSPESPSDVLRGGDSLVCMNCTRRKIICWKQIAGRGQHRTRRMTVPDPVGESG